MKSALQQELQQLDGLPFIAGIIWTVLIGLSLIAIAIIYFRGATNKINKGQLAKETKKSKPEGF